MVREVEWTEANLVVGSRWPGAGQKQLVGDGAERGGGVIGGSAVPVRDWWQGVVGELHGVKAKVIEVLGWLGCLCSDGSTTAGVHRRRERGDGSYAGDRAWLASL